MIDADRFVAAGRPRWDRLATLMTAGGPVTAGQWSELASLYRALCADLSRARGEDLPEDLQHFLDDLAARAHNQLYGARGRAAPDLLRFLAEEVPRQVRASAVFVWLSAALLLVPLGLAMAGAYASEDFTLQVMDEASLRQVEASYAEPTNDRSSADALAASGFYVYNNVGIAFRCFATGIVGGLGSVFFLVYNGLNIGVVFGHLASTGRGWNLLGFISGHAAWELTGIVLAGAGGLRMGWALVSTGGRTRWGSLRAASPELFRLVMGSAAMLGVAASIEGMWSGSPVSLGVRLGFGVLQVGLVLAWLLVGGRRTR